MDSILEGVRAKPGGISMTLEHIRVILDQLHCQSCNWGAGASYSIDLKSIIDTCQNDEVEALVLTRFGKEACRIFRLLINNGRPFETDRVMTYSTGRNYIAPCTLDDYVLAIFLLFLKCLLLTLLILLIRCDELENDSFLRIGSIGYGWDRL